MPDMKIFYANLATPGDAGSSGVNFMVVSFDGPGPLLRRVERELNNSLGLDENQDEPYEVEPLAEIKGFRLEDLNARREFLRECSDLVEEVDICLPDGEKFPISGGPADTLFWIGRILDETFSVAELPALRKRIYDAEDPLCFEHLVEVAAVGDFLSLDRLCEAEKKPDGEGSLGDLAVEVIENRVAMAAGWLQVNPVPVITAHERGGIRIDWKKGYKSEMSELGGYSYPAKYNSIEEAFADLRELSEDLAD